MIVKFKPVYDGICKRACLLYTSPARILKKEEEMVKFKNLDRPLAEQVKLYEKEIIRKKLKQHNGIKDTVAKELGLSRATLYRKLSELGIN